MEVMEKAGKTTFQQRLDDLGHKAIAIYDSIKGQYEPHYNGRFLTIDVESKRVMMSETFDDAAEVWQNERQPDQMFFILKIGEIDIGQMFSFAGRI